MNIEQFIRDNYAAACRKQNKLKDGDQAMVAIVHDDTNLGVSFPLFFVFQGCGLMPPDCAQAES